MDEKISTNVHGHDPCDLMSEFIQQMSDDHLLIPEENINIVGQGKKFDITYIVYY